jgi:hypothetical protein
VGFAPLPVAETKNLRALGFLTIHSIRTNTWVETRIEHATTCFRPPHWTISANLEPVPRKGMLEDVKHFLPSGSG